METLDGTEWDLVISGTGLTQSLLALSLSRSGKRVLHVDENDYYGENEAAFSLSEAEEWATKPASTSNGAGFSHASTIQPVTDIPSNNDTKLASSRAYSITLSPQLIYSRSKIIDIAVSTHIHTQLDFQASGSVFVVNPHPASFSLTRLSRVPSGREDVFEDTQLDLRAKRSLMKFLRFVNNYEEQAEVWESEKEKPFPAFLEEKFGLPPTSHGPILALTMSKHPPLKTTTEIALPLVARHIRSIGVFGPGFGAVFPKWGGLAEVVQVACRACAVGGGVYVLGKGVKNIARKDDAEARTKLELELTDGEKVLTRWLAKPSDGVSDKTSPQKTSNKKAHVISRSISIVSSPLPTLFPQTSEGGPMPAGATIAVPASDPDEPPVHILAHTSESGECPRNHWKSPSFHLHATSTLIAMMITTI